MVTLAVLAYLCCQWGKMASTDKNTTGRHPECILCDRMWWESHKSNKTVTYTCQQFPQKLYARLLNTVPLWEWVDKSFCDSATLMVIECAGHALEILLSLQWIRHLGMWACILVKPPGRRNSLKFHSWQYLGYKCREACQLFYQAWSQHQFPLLKSCQ